MRAGASWPTCLPGMPATCEAKLPKELGVCPSLDNPYGVCYLSTDICAGGPVALGYLDPIGSYKGYKATTDDNLSRSLCGELVLTSHQDLRGLGGRLLSLRI